jgi:hypothetical protein
LHHQFDFFEDLDKKLTKISRIFETYGFDLGVGQLLAVDYQDPRLYLPLDEQFFLAVAQKFLYECFKHGVVYSSRFQICVNFHQIEDEDGPIAHVSPKNVCYSLVD